MSRFPKNNAIISIMTVLVLLLSCVPRALGASINISVDDGAGKAATTAISVDAVVTTGPDGQAVFGGDGDINFNQSGEPQIPWKVMHVLLPPNAKLDTVAARINPVYEPVEGLWEVAPTPPQLTLIDGKEVAEWPTGKNIVNGYDVDIYEQDAFWPTVDVRLAGKGRLRGWKMAEIAVPLVSYNPVTGELLQLVEADISVTSQVEADVLATSRKGQAARVSKLKGKDRAKKLAVNFDVAASGYEPDELDRGGVLPLSPPSGNDGYVIITTNAIRASSTKLADFVAHKEDLGFTVTVIDEDDTGATTTGDAAATKLREWLQANYESMDMKYALIIGDPRPGAGYSHVPMKMYPCEGRNIPTDYFYAELTCDWDKDGDGIIGERGAAATSGDEIERYFEVYVGRIPYYGTMADMDAILQKTMDYEDATNAYWRRNTLITVVPASTSLHFYDWGEQVKSDILEPKAIPSDRLYRNGYGHTVTDYDIVPPPEYPASAYPTTVWSQGQYGLHIWSTHGSPTSASGIMYSSGAANLNDNYPSAVWQGSCQNAWPEITGNLSYSILKNGGIVTLGATRNSYYVSETDFSNSPSDCGMGYRYAKGISEGKSCGEALWDLKEETSGWWIHNWTLFNPYGDPSVVVMSDAPPFTVAPIDPFCISFVKGNFPSISSSYTLSNNTGAALNWTAAKTAAWLDVPAGGTIAAGNSAVINFINSTADSLPVGTHTDTIIFTDTTNSIVEQRDVILNVYPRRLLGYWKLNETSGTSTTDFSGNNHNGTLKEGQSFDNDSVAGKFDNALKFDGVDDYVELPSLDFNSNRITITAWIKRNGDQNTAGIVFKRSGKASGLNFGAGSELRYHWRDSSDTYSWHSGLMVPDNTWTFVALAIEPTQATIYMDDGTLYWATNTVNHAKDSFTTDSAIGRDWPGREFTGEIDEVRIYNYILNQEEMAALILGGRAELINPGDGEKDVNTDVTLDWASGAAAVSHNVYIGTNETAVADATVNSPEFMGNQTPTSFSCALDFLVEYFVRIDEIDSLGNVITGDVRNFTSGSSPQGDGRPPQPGTMTWSVEPVVVEPDLVTMTATKAADENGVEYFFECTAGNGHDSGWQDSPVYPDSGFGDSVQVTYRARARDKSVAQNETDWSAPATVVINLPGDFDKDLDVDLVDLSFFLTHWPDSPCNNTAGDASDWCYGTDLNKSGKVDGFDFDLLADNWLKVIEVIETNLIARWKLDESTGAIASDSTGNNYDGNLVNSPTWQPTGGQINGALELDGVDQYIDAPFILNPADGPFTACAWVKDGQPNEKIICQTDGTGIGRNWLQTDTSGNLFTNLKTPSGSYLGSSYTDHTNGSWHHVAVVWDGARRHLYADGTEVAADPADLGAPLESCDGRLYIGAHKTLGADLYWTGRIDDVRIYNCALTSAEIDALAN